MTKLNPAEYFNELKMIIPRMRVMRAPMVIVAMIIGAAFEVLGLSLILPLLEVISGANTGFAERISRVFPDVSHDDLVIVSVVLFGLLFVIKGLYLSFLVWLISDYTYSVKADVSNKLMRSYLNSNYEFHLQNNSAQLIRNLTTEASQFSTHLLAPLLIMISEVFVVLAIGSFLVYLQPVGSLTTAALLILLATLFQKFSGNYTSRLGAARQVADGKVIQKSQEALGGIKDVTALGMKDYFFEKFRVHNLLSTSASAKSFVMNQLPRMYLETVAVCVFCVFILIMIATDENLNETLPTLSVFALAAFRLLPSANRILAALNSLKFSEKVLLSLSEHLSDIVHLESNQQEMSKKRVELTFNKEMTIKDLCYAYPGQTKNALSDINITVQKGECIGCVGKSGSGKSTLADILLGLLRPSSGQIQADGVNIFDNIDHWQALVGYVQQDIFLLDDSIKRNIAFGLSDSEIEMDKLKAVVQEAQLSEFVETLENGLNTQLGERGVRLSGGQKQRIGIARALYRDTPVLIFDEATSALDSQTEAEIVESFQSLKSKRTMIIVAHRLSTLGYCDRIIELKNGKVNSIEGPY